MCVLGGGNVGRGGGMGGCWLLSLLNVCDCVLVVKNIECL